MMTWIDRRKGKTKYQSTRTELDGRSFASKLEAAVYQMLKLRERAGEIRVLQAQDHIYLTDARIEYVPDFKCEYVATGEVFWAEAKGYADPKWPIKKKLWRFYGPGPLELWTGNYRNPQLEETIIPKRGNA
jgi:hypothetical protein